LISCRADGIDQLAKPDARPFCFGSSIVELFRTTPMD
jgi:hypothetical protein